MSMRDTISTQVSEALRSGHSQFGRTLPGPVWTALKGGLARTLIGPTLQSLVASNGGMYALNELSRSAATSVLAQVEPRVTNARCTWEATPTTNLDEIIAEVLNSFWGPTDNIFCKTGPGGGVDPTCTKDSPDTGGGSGGASFDDAKFDLTARTIRGAKKIKFLEGDVGPDNAWLGGATYQKLTVTTTSGTKFEVKAVQDNVLTHGEPMRGVTFQVAPQDLPGARTVKKADFIELYDKVAPAVLAYIDHYKPEVVGLSANSSGKNDLYRDIVRTIASARPKYFAAHEYSHGGGGYGGTNNYVLGPADRQSHMLRAFRSSTGMMPGRFPYYQVLNMRLSAELVEWDGVDNIFCATGQGGGVDPTCTKEGGGTLKSKIKDAMQAVQFGEGTPEMLTPDKIVSDVRDIYDNMSADLRAQIEEEIDNEVAERSDDLIEGYEPKVPQDTIDDWTNTTNDQLAHRINQTLISKLTEEGVPYIEGEKIREDLLKTLGSHSGLDGMQVIAKKIESEYPLLKEVWGNQVDDVKSQLPSAISSLQRALISDRLSDLERSLRDELTYVKAKEEYNKNPLKYGSRFLDLAARDTWYRYAEKKIPNTGLQVESSVQRDMLQTELKGGRLFTVTARSSERLPAVGEKYSKTVISFKDDSGSYDATGKGSAHEVFGKVVPAVAQYVEKYKPDVVEFSASGKSRVGLYDKLIKTVASLSPDYMAVYYGKENDDRNYYVVRRDRQDTLLLQAPRDPDGVLVNRESFITLEAEFNPVWFTSFGWLTANEDWCEPTPMDVQINSTPEQYITLDTPALDTRNAKTLMDTGNWTPPTLLYARQVASDTDFVDRVVSGQTRNALLFEACPDGTEKLIANVTDGVVEVHDTLAYERFFTRISQ